MTKRSEYPNIRIHPNYPNKYNFLNINYSEHSDTHSDH